jgi:NAD(P)-dependent dehydrogenase (short-subunit alcohol dehydrogenase family)
MDRLQGKVAIVTGGNSGVGAATALLFAQEGAKVVISARRQTQLDEVAGKIRQAGGQVLPVVADISKPEDAKHLLAQTLETFGQVDVLINNAGVLEVGLKPIDRVEDADMDRLLDTNTKGTMYCIREISAHMAKAGQGSIVNMASEAGVYGNGGAAYVASKSAIVGVTRHTALRFAGTGVRCNVVCPGTVVTPMVANMRPDTMDPDMFAAMGKHSDLRCPPCQPQDVANILLFLASDESRAITGQTIVCDFGSAL